MSDFNDFNNRQVASLPKHLKQFIVAQHYEHYTPVDHAVWRYVMRQNYSYLKNVAYYPYIPGLEQAGLSIEKVPNLQEMNDALGKIGWGAVTVDGFIPPVAFMEYQAYKVLVIAADIRQLNHIEYTPAPDIIHESAGHAPIIGDTAYNQYLSYFGSIGAKAIFSSKDFELYEAIRRLSILKEMPDADGAAIAKAEKEVAFCQKNLGEPSEMALLSRLHWWTVEYGLIGSLENPKIYGAGLLSSIGESANCMKPEVIKITYTLDAVNYSFDITKEQPQLFVTPTFQNLIEVLETFADTMAFRKGGTESMLKAIECKNSCTAVFSSGLQLSGVFTDVGMDLENQTTFIKTTGASALAFDNKELEGHGKSYHAEGYSSPVGKLKGSEKALEDYTDADLAEAGILKNSSCALFFENGFHLQGNVESWLRKENKLVLISFSECTLSDSKGTVYFKPEWGIFDMAVGEKIVSVYNGAADKDAFEEIALVSGTNTHHPNYNELTLAYHGLFKQVRTCRENNSGYDILPEIWAKLQAKHREDWLCSLEILELLELNDLNTTLAREIRTHLENKASTEPEYSKLIHDGLYIIKHPVSQLN